jgi:stage II sporulation protein P
MNVKLKAAGTVLLAVAACACVITHFPAISAQKSALAAAGFILPVGAVKELKQEPKTFPSPSTAVSPSSKAPAASSVSSKSNSSPASSATLPQSSGAASTQALPEKELGNHIMQIDLSGSGTEQDGIHVKNTNKNHTLNVASVLKEKPPLHIKTDGSPMVLVYHTHTTEAFADCTRSRDPTKSVVAVGDAIVKSLKDAGIGAVHDTTVHDYPAFNGSYTRSAKTIANDLAKYPSIQVTLDVHRDTMTAENGTRYKPTVLVNGKSACQIMVIAGCDDDGSLGFPNWEQNLRLAVRFQKGAAEMFPHLMRPLDFGPTRYNEQMTPGSLLAEFGTEVNTLDEAVYSGSLFGKVMAKQLKALASG